MRTTRIKPGDLIALKSEYRSPKFRPYLFVTGIGNIRAVTKHDALLFVGCVDVDNVLDGAVGLVIAHDVLSYVYLMYFEQAQ